MMTPELFLEMSVQILSAAVGSLAFGMLFNLWGKKLLSVALGGALGWALFLLFSCFGMREAIAYFLVALLVSLYAEAMARLQKAPATVFVAPSLIPLVPGSSLYYTMAYAFGGDTARFSEKAITTLILASALAVGVMVATVCARLLFRPHITTKGEK